MQQPKDAASLYWHWAHQRGREQVAAALTGRFDNAPQEVDAFLDCFVGEGWDMESGLPRRSDFDRENYDSVSRLVAPEYIAVNLRQRFGAELDAPNYYLNDEMPVARRFAHQFMFVHGNVLAAADVVPDTAPEA